MKRLPIFIFFVLCMLFIPVASFAVADPCTDPFLEQCPIDGGLSLLIAAGIGLGAKKAFKERKKALDFNP